MTTIHTPNLTLQSANVQHIEALIESAQAFETAFGIKIIEGYLEFPEALSYSLKQLQSGGMAEPWASYLFTHSADNALIGMGGYKGGPDADGMVEIGYASEAAQGMMKFVFEQDAVKQVWAHTLAERNASVHVLTQCGFTRTQEINDPDDGKIWRWEIMKDQWLQQR